jgi:phosphate starvation-inducible protein PhoH and related proteins
MKHKIPLPSKSKCTGDLTQIDLPMNTRSGLRKAIDILRDIEGIDVIRLTVDDVVRHRLVKEVIKAFERDSEQQREYWEESNGRLPSRSKNVKDEEE